VIVALLMAIPSPAAKSDADAGVAPSINQLSVGDTKSTTAKLQILPEQDAAGMWRVVDGEHNLVAFAARTLPAAREVVGYRGPTEASILLDKDSLKVLSVALLSSADTEEHVDAVVQDNLFLRQFDGWPWGGPADDTEIDAVSGATLTSLAMAEGVLKRIGGARPSLIFRDPLSVDEIRNWFPAAVTIDDNTGEVRNDKSEGLGRVLRSGPLSDTLIGYQGPTEMLMKLSLDGRVESMKLRRSFDNEPYVDYVRTEAGFWSIFEGKTLSELATFVPEDAGVEGVSGATMTSLAVADTIVTAAKAAEENVSAAPTPSSGWLLFAPLKSVRWSRAEVATIVALLMAGILSRLGWFHNHIARRIWLLAVLAVIGLWSGNLVSMALIAGWSAEGVAWHLAPGLSAITVMTLLLPPLTKSNPYCNHLCPHGAVQQLVKPNSRSRRRLRLSRSASRWLRRIPGVTLVIAYLALISVPTIDLSSWEPFHAYLFRIATWGSIALAVATVALAAVIPMGYCRLGCPTGRLIDYLRRSAASDRMEASDFVAIGLLMVALTLQFSN
jgi:NosR/NirI family nitrous oxide reductase transcriptional regulator